VPFDPAELAPALPDVIVAIGVAFIFAAVTFKARPAASAEETLEAIRFAQKRLLKQQEPPPSTPPAEKGS
jgi:hypothetical protein